MFIAIVFCFFFRRFIYNAACIILPGRPWGPRGACFSWYHSSITFLFGSQGPLEREGKREVGSPQSPRTLWPLMAPSNERRHSHTHSDVLTPRRAPSFPLLLPLALHSPLFPPSLNWSPALGECLCLLLFCFRSPSCFFCFRIPSPPIPYTPPPVHARLLSGAGKKKKQQPSNGRFYWSV